ncbi:GH3 auxin-responsive promoter family protein [Baaleninema simplex]|uniref:GH3 auxin-responsive promoter family protein n=1 Tax=Baaleninema simplex TaxID=2862350 RepID=UPI000344A6E6|nr:GH3 auxin-responsive promoter family protein [Baaleninema simplex]
MDFLPILTFAADRARKNFNKKVRQQSAVQENFLFDLLKRYQNTELGKQYRVADIETIEQFKDRIPVLDYTAYEPYIRRIAEGEPNVLTSDPVVYLNRTSGSTGKQKLIPVTKRFQNILGWANLVSLGFLTHGLRKRGKKLGKNIVLNALEAPKYTRGGIEYGSAGPGVLKMGSFFYKQLFVHPLDTFKPKDYFTRSYTALLFSLKGSPTSIGSNFPMVILQFCNWLEEYADALIEDIETGSIAPWLKLEPELRASLEAQLFPDRDRADRLRSILKTEGRLLPRLVWPELACYTTARGGTSDFYLQRFPEYFGDIPGFGAVFASAEGTFSIYPDLDTDGSVLAVETGFFEFVPPDEWENEHPKTLRPSEVKVGEYYRLLVTNHSGFYRYDIGDVFQVVGFYEEAPLIVFRYRRGGLLSSTTEKTTEYHVTKTMQILQDKFAIRFEDFCVTLSDNEFPARYLVNVELAPGYRLDDAESFIDAFDRVLKDVHSYYEIKRDMSVPPPRLQILKPGSFEIVRQRQVERGIPAYQLKFPHISEDRAIVSGLEVDRVVQLPS